MTMNKLMANAKARDIYLSLPANREPLALADDYRLAKLQNDQDTMLAIECHLRDLARQLFHKDDVRQALAIMERTKATRRPGNQGTKDLQHIADQIERAYAAGDFQATADGRIKFTFGTLKLTCLDRPGAVAWMAAKYRRGYK